MKMEKSKIVKRIGFLGLLILLTGLFIGFSFYTNPHKYFEDSRKNDGHGGLALEREANEFIKDGCGSGTMLDTVTGLCWQRNMSAEGQMNWSSAISYCNNLNLGGHSDWVLPTRNELFTLINQIGPAGTTCDTLDSFGFSNCVNGDYWSRTTYELNTAYAWIVNFNGGHDGSNAKGDSNCVVCVRENP